MRSLPRPRLIAGHVVGSTGALLRSTGLFTVARTTTGTYLIAPTNDFGALVAAYATPVGSTRAFVLAAPSTSAPGGFTITMQNSAGTTADFDFFFVAYGLGVT